MDPKRTELSRHREFRRRTDTERAALLESETAFTAALEAAGFGLFDYYPLSGELFWSGVTRECFGLSRDAPVNYNVFLVGLHLEDRKGVVDALQRALRREDEGRVRTECRTSGIEDGKERLIAISGQAFFNQWGEAVRFLGTTRDITEGRAETGPGRTGDLFRRVFDNVYEGILLHAVDGSIEDMNNRFLDMYRIGREQLRRMSIADISASSNPLEDLPRIWSRVIAGERQLLEWKAKRPSDGSVFDVEVFLTRMDIREEPLILATVRDISDRKQLEQRLRESEERYKLLFDRSPLPKWVLELETFRFLEVNNAAVDHYGYTRDEFRQMSVADVRTPEEFGKLREWVRVCCGEGRKFEGEVLTKHRKKSGEQFDAEVRYTEVRYMGKRAGLGVVIDVTKKKRAEQERERLIAELKRSNEELQQFAYLASHDLQEPLRTVASFSELLARRYGGKLDAAADRYISFIIEGAGRMSMLINDLLAYSRVGTRGGVFERVSMDAVVDGALADLQSAVRESGAVVTKERLPEVAGDQMRLRQLMQNLLANAIKFRKRDRRPEIRISAEKKEHQWVFAVRDNGIGIEPRFFERIFTIFQRLHTREEYAGTGVGLAICKRIAERHGGRIWVESTPGEGSTFYFALPDRSASETEGAAGEATG